MTDNWLAFSLNHQQPPPFHLQDGADISTAATAADGCYSDSSSMTVIPIDDPFHHHHHQGWRFENGDGGPKLEDFLGGGINVNISPNSDYHDDIRDCYLPFYPYYQNPHQNSEAVGAITPLRQPSIPPQQHDDCLSLAVAPPPIPMRPKSPAAETRKRSLETTKSARKSMDGFGQRTSRYRGVTRHRWTGRYEAHLWDNSCRKEGQTRKGRQVYLGGYDQEEKAARAYDLAALKYWGPTTHINFSLAIYEKELEEMKNMSRQEFVANLRRKSSGFSRGASMYRGVTRHHQHGRWQARIGRVAGNKDLYLGTFSTQEEAAEAYDIAAIKFRGTSAVTNFNISRYDVKRICSSSTLIAGELAKRSPRGSSPLMVEEPLLAITNGDDFADMVWAGNQEEPPSASNLESTNPQGDTIEPR